MSIHRICSVEGFEQLKIAPRFVLITLRFLYLISKTDIHDWSLSRKSLINNCFSLNFTLLIIHLAEVSEV